MEPLPAIVGREGFQKFNGGGGNGLHLAKIGGGPGTRKARSGKRYFLVGLLLYLLSKS
jgi:hypothetical protein